MVAKRSGEQKKPWPPGFSCDSWCRASFRLEFGSTQATIDRSIRFCIESSSDKCTPVETNVCIPNNMVGVTTASKKIHGGGSREGSKQVVAECRGRKGSGHAMHKAATRASIHRAPFQVGRAPFALRPKKARPSIGRKDATGRTDSCSGSAAATVSIGAGVGASGTGDKNPNWVRCPTGKPTPWQDKKATLLARNGSRSSGVWSGHHRSRRSCPGVGPAVFHLAHKKAAFKKSSRQRNGPGGIL